MQLSEKAICIQGFIVEMGLEWRISSLTGPYIDNNPVMVILFLQHWVEPWDADVVEGVQRKGGMVGPVRVLSVFQTCAKSISGKDIWTVLLNYHLNQNTQQTMEGRGDRAVVNMKSSPAVQRGIKSLVKNHTSPLDVCSRHRCGPCTGAWGPPALKRSFEIPSHLQTRLFWFCFR